MQLTLSIGSVGGALFHALFHARACPLGCTMLPAHTPGQILCGAWALRRWLAQSPLQKQTNKKNLLLGSFVTGKWLQ